MAGVSPVPSVTETHASIVHNDIVGLVEDSAYCELLEEKDKLPPPAVLLVAAPFGNPKN
jgi:hypothetical protein